MTRAADTVLVKPGNNIYTVLAAVATLVTLIALIILFVRAAALFPEGGLLGG
jgi:hypothetical protein